MYGNTKKLRIVKAILRKKNGPGGINLPDFRLYYKAAVIKTVWYWHKERNIDQWNKTESPEINPQIHTPMDTLSLTKEARIYNGKETVSSASGVGKLDMQKSVKACKLVRIEHTLSPCPKINSKWLKDLK